MSVEWEIGRRDVVGLFLPADYPGRIFEVELTEQDVAALLGGDETLMVRLRERVAEALDVTGRQR